MKLIVHRMNQIQTKNQKIPIHQVQRNKNCKNLVTLRATPLLNAKRLWKENLLILMVNVVLVVASFFDFFYYFYYLKQN